MSSEAARLVFPGYKFGIDDPADALALVELGVGGFCLYGGEAREVRELTASLQKAAKSPLLFCADYEDGVASQSAGGTWFSSSMGLGAAGSTELAFQKGALTALEARALGVRWVLAPVVDLATAPANPIVNVRAFGEDPRLVVRLARAYMKGLRSQGALSCLKHFPGHGETESDSHLELPSVKVPRETLASRELIPYKELAAETDSVMTGHLLVPALEKDGTLPVSLSKAAIGHLRGELGFQGLVSTDALSMHAVARNFPEIDAAALALLGGSDILLVPADARALVYALLDRAQAEPALAAAIEAALARLSRAAQKALPEPDFSVVHCAEHQAASRAMAAACLAWSGKPLAAPLTSLGYLEPDADVPEEWQGKAFIEALRGHGVRIGAESDTTVVGCFLRPVAYSGRIRYEEELAALVREKSAKAKRVIVVSFGSPYVFGQFDKVEAGLCAFAGSPAAQEAAAWVLVGKASASGTMPVSTAGTAS